MSSQFQRQRGRRYKFDTSGEPLIEVPKYNSTLEAYWALEGPDPTNWLDTANSHDLVPVASPATGTGKYNTCLDVDGGDNGLSVAHAAAQHGDSLAIAAWLNRQAATLAGGGYCEIVTKAGEWRLMFKEESGADLIEFRAKRSGGAWDTVTINVPGGDISLATWYHVFGCRDTLGQVHVGFNGVLSTNVGAVSSLEDATDIIYIPYGDGAESWYEDFLIDEVPYWVDPVISSSAAAARLCGALYNGGDGVFWNGSAWVESV